MAREIPRWGSELSTCAGFDDVVVFADVYVDDGQVDAVAPGQEGQHRVRFVNWAPITLHGTLRARATNGDLEFPDESVVSARTVPGLVIRGRPSRTIAGASTVVPPARIRHGENTHAPGGDHALDMSILVGTGLQDVSERLVSDQQWVGCIAATGSSTVAI